ncbi:MAG: hypothetical protein L0287_03935, partial [Anaerolineae bacterium]|nr:hypothetical protein [Anaerolineae bacterium]
MKFRTLILLVSIIIVFNSVLHASSVRAIVRENNASFANVQDADVCLLAADGSVLSQQTGDGGITTFQNVVPGNFTVRAHKTGFNPFSIDAFVKPNTEYRVVLALTEGNSPPLPCNVVGPRDVTVTFQQITANPVPTASIVDYRLTIDNIGQSSTPTVITRIDLPPGFQFNQTQNPSFNLTCGATGGTGGT